MFNFIRMTTDNNYQGCYAEQAFASECIRRGFNVSKPFLDSSPYDLIVDDHKTLYKIQVKYTAKTPEIFRRTIHISLSNNKAQYTKQNVDYFAIYSEHYGGFFVIKNTGKMKALRLSVKNKYSENFNNFAFNSSHN